jgi:hypothetical protein
MKDKTFNARNDEMRARRTKASDLAPDANYKVDDSPAMQKKAARQRAKGIAATAEAQPGSIEALADATDAAIRAASPKPSATKAKKKHPDDVTAKVAKDLKRALAEQEKREDAAKHAAPEPTVADGANALSELFDRAEREGKPVAKKKVASLAKTIDAAIAADKVAPATKPAKVNCLDTGLERTGKLTVVELARAWIAHLDAGGKTTASTIASYANDLKTAVAFFGADSPVAGINGACVDVFNMCDGVMKLKSGAPKAMPTILEMRRAFRMALELASENSVDKI